MRLHRVMTATLIALTLTIATVQLRAQNDPRQVLGGMIYQLSTGTPNPLWYSAEMWQLMAIQTNNSGLFPQLRQLGLVQNIVVTQWSALPGGMLYAMSVQHAYGQSYWLFGIGSISNQIEYVSFVSGPGSIPYSIPGGTTVAQTGPTGPGATALPPPSQAPSVGTPPEDRPAPKPKPTADQTEACRKFPNLC